MEMQVNLSPLLRKMGVGGGGQLSSQGQNREAGQVWNGLAEQDRLLAQHLHQMLTGMWGQGEPGRCSDRNRESEMLLL